jgi:tetratricopeptide (TPR) repeat protein
VAEAEAVADRVVGREARYLFQNWRRFSAVEWADVELVRTADGLACDAAARVPQVTLQWNNAFHQVWQAVLWSDLAEAERLAEAALEQGLRDEQPDAFTVFGVQLAMIRDFQGRFDELIPLLEDAVVTTPTATGYRSLLAWAYVVGGRHDEAAALLDEDLALDLQVGHDYGWSISQTMWADVATHVRHRPAAELLRDRLRPFADQLTSGALFYRLPFAHYLGRLGHALGLLDEADADFRRAIAVGERLGSPVCLAHTRSALAALLAERGANDDRDRAAALARDALAAALVGGYLAVEREARATLVGLGEDA